MIDIFIKPSSSFVFFGTSKDTTRCTRMLLRVSLPNTEFNIRHKESYEKEVFDH